MTARDLLREAWDSLMSRRLRTLLSVLGMAAGVGTIVAALAIMNGATRQAVNEIGALGIDNLIVRAVSDHEAQGTPRAPRITTDDADSLRRRFPRASISALRSVHDLVGVSAQDISVVVAGVTATWRTTANLSLTDGRWFGDTEHEARTAVINGVLARVLFGSRPAIGQQVLAAGEWRTVVGILADTGSHDTHTVIQALDPDRTVFVPLETLDITLGVGDEGDAVEQIVVQLPPGTDVTLTAETVRAALTARHPDESHTFEVLVPQELLRARLRAERSLHWLLLSIGGLALIISGIGIMNIMVASVIERAAEIGVRRAFGARRSAVIRQFATEAALIGAAGGLVGLFLGLTSVVAVAALGGWPVAISLGSVIGSIGLAIGVGLAASAYPAHLASTLSPVEALRE